MTTRNQAAERLHGRVAHLLLVRADRHGTESGAIVLDEALAVAKTEGAREAVERIRSRIDLDFAAVCEDNLDGVFGYLLYLTGNRTVAEDLAAETFERALRRFKRFDPHRGTARTWLLTLARSGGAVSKTS